MLACQLVPVAQMSALYGRVSPLESFTVQPCPVPIGALHADAELDVRIESIGEGEPAHIGQDVPVRGIVRIMLRHGEVVIVRLALG